MTPIALTIAGSDSSGGAGIQADLKTFSALGVYGASALVALTAQNTRGVSAIHDVPADFITAQIDAVMDDLAVGAVKIGMVSRSESIAAIADALIRRGAENVVVDPVMIATSGARLLAEDAIETLRARLLPLALVLTPNLPEAAELLGEAEARTEQAMEAQGRALLALGPRAVLMKGGHGDGSESVDLLVGSNAETVRLPAPRVGTRNTHGTGCTLSSAIAAGLARGKPLEQSACDAKAYVASAIAAADQLDIGRGNGPVHHFHDWWTRVAPRDAGD
ncbi:bifunctional hydroxymethylpyrimidine kinase/phosphomethylpyrimidine kinase [Chelatococcus sambhunathii]|uniref:hydroxymethylpyrimidine kinase n=1 Tax=Chelatococcus sambhunathii TaxID=363953 RepID=A0ABU1DEJ3_9HYPH|nr:bifunctional hydroxymethylpyrimidine kinase/phosphomethylpyrimidine kinase [Chelatococcus sambhunathii]MDR4306539.1 bifunctional hydroxymethylpyrimidine kinase/phosphomethylpyrimidine kinase [Chelatococcus sambhunathii]